MSPDGVTFHAADGLSVSADLYFVPKARAFLVLCHRSHFHRGEYVEIAPRLARLGYGAIRLMRKPADPEHRGRSVVGWSALIVSTASLLHIAQRPTDDIGMNDSGGLIGYGVGALLERAVATVFRAIDKAATRQATSVARDAMGVAQEPK